MRQKIYFGLIIAVLITSCGAPNILTTIKDSAKNEAEQGNFAKALEAWKQYLNQQPIEEIEGSDFANAAQTAFYASDLEQAVSWFDQARYKDYADPDMYSTLSKIYNSQDNLSKELSALEFYIDNYTENIDGIYNRLFDVYFEIEMYDKAFEVWGKLDENSKTEESKRNAFFLINKKMENDVICDSLSLIILENEPENLEALEWNARKFYSLGEERYQREMEKYNTNNTTRQYRILLKELDLVTADLKKSLVYFEKLWEMEPGEKYASYFANIYARFGDEKKSDYYRNFIK